MSELTSFTNDSSAREYDDVDHDQGQSSPSDESEHRNRTGRRRSTLSRMTDLMQRMFTNIEKHQDKVEMKSEEICNLKVSNAIFESMVDKKDEIIQQQALKIHDLSAKIQLLEAKTSCLEKKNSDLEKQMEKAFPSNEVFSGYENSLRRKPFRRNRLFSVHDDYRQ